MNFNVTLDDKQINEIASVTADKVLATVKYQRNNEDWYESEIKDLRLAVSKRDSMLVQKDLCIERLRESRRKLRTQLKEISLNEKDLATIMGALIDKSICIKHMIETKGYVCEEELESLKRQSEIVDEIANKVSKLINN